MFEVPQSDIIAVELTKEVVQGKCGPRYIRYSLVFTVFFFLKLRRLMLDVSNLFYTKCVLEMVLLLNLS